MHLFLVRHGDSPFNAINDHQRPLSGLGQRQAEQAGAFIKQNAPAIKKQLVCSDAKRTRATANIIQQILQPCSISARNDLYHAQIGEWCDVIQHHATCEVLVLVGHNPTISYLAKHLQPKHPKHFNPACVGYYQLEIAADGLKLPAQLTDFLKPDAK